MGETIRQRARRLAEASWARGDATGWFDTVYAAAEGRPDRIPWADMRPNPNLLEWMSPLALRGPGQRALVVGCGLGDDAEALAGAGFAVVAFDVSPAAIAWCRRRFPTSLVRYVAADLLAPPPEWRGAFDFVLEAYTLQALPPDARPQAVEAVAGFVAPGGTLLVICRGRNIEDDPGGFPWPLTRAEVDLFRRHGLRETRFDDYIDAGGAAAVRRFGVTYRRSPAPT
ncbi:MAG TPA: class I SAM-dependent methyltransferase [bacterium]|nr:class I SAM-dependent methyltransferase [bacterium]